MTPGSKSDCCQTDLHFDPDSQHDPLPRKVADPWFDGLDIIVIRSLLWTILIRGHTLITLAHKGTIKLFG